MVLDNHRCDLDVWDNETRTKNNNNNNNNCEDGEMFHLLVANWLKEIWSSMTSEVWDNVKKTKIKQKNKTKQNKQTNKLSYNNYDRHTYKRLID